MTAEQHLQLILGQKDFAIAQLQAQLEAAQAENGKLKEKLGQYEKPANGKPNAAEVPKRING